DDRVDGLLQNQDAVGNGGRERAARAAFSGDGGDGWDLQPGHFPEIASDGLGLSTLLSAQTWVGAHEIDEGEDRTPEFFCQLHGSQGFAVAFGIGHSEFAMYLLLGGASLEVADDHDLFAV